MEVLQGEEEDDGDGDDEEGSVESEYNKICVTLSSETNIRVAITL